MKIKTKKQMRLDELIKHIYDNDDANRVFIDDEEEFAVHSNSSCSAVNIEHLKGYGGKKCVSKRETFTVEVEEELTEGILLDRITIFFYDTQTRNNGFCTYRDLSIQEALEMNKGTLKFISMAVDDVLIWTKEHGTPEEGVLEVDTE